MNKADPLITAFRQLAVAKTALRAGPPSATAAKDGKDKAEHFREQLRSVAQGAKPAPKVEMEGAEKGAAQDPEVPDRVAEVTDEVTTRPKGRAGKSSETSPNQAAAEVTPLPQEWRGPEAALSAVISRFDQAQARSARDDDATTRVVHSQAHAEQREMLSEPVGSTKSQNADDLPEQRFVLSVDSAETRASPSIKVVVREQETHFEPVQQLTLLQKIVDRMVTDLPASAQAGAGPAGIALPDVHRAADKPLKMLTLQLDPPELGAVTVKMRLTGNAVEIRLSADRYETTQLLQHERGALTDLMQSAGYTFDIASIDQSRASDANTGAGQQQAQSEQRQSQQLHNGPQIDNATSERQSGDAQAGTRHNRQQHDQFTAPVDRHQDQEVAPNRNGGALYL
jgi:chemotaxis protein MotD